jgi:hypothetical protein
MAIQRQTMTIPFSAGLNTKGDKRAQASPLLDIALNCEFDDLGGLRTRFPFGAITSAIVGGGTLADCRKLASLDNERLVFTKDKLYSWIPSASAWQYRGDHLAVMTDEETLFAQPDDQYCCDRAELNGVIVYVWTIGTASQTVMYLAARDKTNGAVIYPPNAVGIVGNAFQPRLIALTDSVLLFYGAVPLGGGAPQVVSVKITLGPFTISGDPITGLPHVVASYFGAAAFPYFDAALVPGQDRCLVVVADTAAVPANQYSIVSIDESFAGATTLGGVLSGTHHALGAPISIAVSPDALFATVAHVSIGTTNVYADVFNVAAPTVPMTSAGGATVGTYGTGTTLTQLTVCFQPVKTSGTYRCVAFWTCDEADNVVFEHRSNWIDTTGAVGTEAPFIYALGLGAHAFAHDTHVYVWATFAGLSFDATDPTGTHSELQNTYYLYRDDGFLVAKAVWGEGAGINPKGAMPSCVVDPNNANAFAFVGGIRRIVPVGSNATDPIKGVENYAERAPRDVIATFDDDRARRSVQFGLTLVITGGLVLQYDGVQLAELGFTSYPWILDLTNAGSGSIAAAGYSYKATDRWTNARGETDRSTTATVANITLGSPSNVTVQTPNLYITRKSNVALEIWRTQGAPPAGAPYFLATSQDPSVVTGDNIYLESNPTQIALASLTDALVDSALGVGPANPENDGVLESLEPPAASVIYTDNQRVFLAGIPGYPNTVYYSRYRADGSVAAFHDDLTIEVPPDGGAVTAISNVLGTLIVWCETATFTFAGVGFDDTGAGANYALAQVLSEDLGALSQESVAFYEDGYLVKTARGWYVLNRSLSYQYVGEGAYKYDAEACLSLQVLTARHQLRIVTPNRVLMFDHLADAWAEWTVNDGLDAILVGGSYGYLTPTGLREELTTWAGYGGVDYSLTLVDIETSWIKVNDQQGRGIVDWMQLLGEFRSACAIRMRMARDYSATSPGVWNYTTDKTWTPFPAVVGSSLQVRKGPRYRRCESIKTRITITNPDGASPLGGPCARLTSLAMLYGIEPNTYGALAAAQKQ